MSYQKNQKHQALIERVRQDPELKDADLSDDVNYLLRGSTHKSVMLEVIHLLKGEAFNRPTPYNMSLMELIININNNIQITGSEMFNMLNQADLNLITHETPLIWNALDQNNSKSLKLDPQHVFLLLQKSDLNWKDVGMSTMMHVLKIQKREHLNILKDDLTTLLKKCDFSVINNHYDLSFDIITYNQKLIQPFTFVEFEQILLNSTTPLGKRAIRESLFTFCIYEKDASLIDKHFDVLQKYNASEHFSALTQLCPTNHFSQDEFRKIEALFEKANMQKNISTTQPNKVKLL